MPHKQVLHGLHRLHIRGEETPSPLGSIFGTPREYTLCGNIAGKRHPWQRREIMASKRKCPRSVTCKSCIRVLRSYGKLAKENKNVQA